jgi:hypothetical protein
MREIRKQLFTLYKKYRDENIIRQHFHDFLSAEQLAEVLTYLNDRFNKPEAERGDDDVIVYTDQVPNLLEIINVSSTRSVQYGRQASVTYDFDAVETTLRQHMVSGSKLLKPNIIGFEFIGTTSIEFSWMKLQKTGLYPKNVDDGILDKITSDLNTHGLEKLLRVLEEVLSFAAKWPTKSGEAFGKVPV